MRIFKNLFFIAVFLSISTLSVYGEESKKDIPDGVVKKYYQDGNIHFEMNYKNGLLNGLVSEYYPNGILKNTKNYIDGEIEGVTNQYNEDGKLIAELTRDRGELSWWKTKQYDYYANGNLKFEYMYDQKIKKGYRKDFYENGQISLEFVIKEGQFMDCKNYDEAGNFVSSECPKE